MAENEPAEPHGRRAPTATRRLAALGVHLLTASGAALALLALVAAAERDFPTMFAWLAAALVVDGGLARKAEVRTAAPEISGATLDLVVDYATYVLVPAYALIASGLLPDGLSILAGMVICVSAAIYFALTSMKTEDWFFRGFPGTWNLFAFYVFLLEPPGWASFVAVLLLAGLSFAPVAFVHPFRVRRFRPLTLAMLAAWSALAGWAIYLDMRPDGFVIAGLVAIALYFTVLGLFRSRETIPRKRR